MLTTIYRFTPPTCTLEIKGKKSPLSRWTNRDTLKNFQFKLSFDDPCIPSDRQITVTGDRRTLEQLKAAVDRHVRETLHGSLVSNIEGDRDKSNDGDRPYLQAKGLTERELFLNSLDCDSKVDKITLTTVQLFDLVTALEAYSTQINALPELKRVKTKKAIPIWGAVAAVAIAGIGITAILLKSSSVQNIASSPQSESSSTIPQLDEVVPPNTPAKSRKRSSQPKINESLSSAKRLPPPPAVNTPKPKPNIPDPADYPLSQVARQSGLDRPTKEKNETESTTTIPTQINPNEDLRLETEIQPDEGQNNISGDTNFLTESDTVISNNDVIKDAPTKPSQSQEIQAYFKNKWQPPTDLKQSLEYRLYLNSNGTIKRVVPLGKASELYLNQTNIPVRGETFISPFDESQTTTIRLLLNPDGGIKTFTE